VEDSFVLTTDVQGVYTFTPTSTKPFSITVTPCISEIDWAVHASSPLNVNDPKNNARVRFSYGGFNDSPSVSRTYVIEKPDTSKVYYLTVKPRSLKGATFNVYLTTKKLPFPVPGYNGHLTGQTTTSAILLEWQAPNVAANYEYCLYVQKQSDLGDQDIHGTPCAAERYPKITCIQSSAYGTLLSYTYDNLQAATTYYIDLIVENTDTNWKASYKWRAITTDQFIVAESPRSVLCSLICLFVTVTITLLFL